MGYQDKLKPVSTTTPSGGYASKLKPIEAKPSMGKEFLKSLLNFPAKVASTAAIAGTSGAALLGSQKANLATQKIQNEGLKLPVVGNVKPIRDPIEAAGVGLEGASFLSGGAGVPTVLRSLMFGKKLAPVIRGAAIGAGSGGQFGAGTALQSEDRSAGNIIKETSRGAAFGGVTGGVLGGLPVLPAAARAGMRAVSKKPLQPLDAAGQILQAGEKEAKLGLKTLQSIDTSDVKTYKELSARIDENINRQKTIRNLDIGGVTTPTRLNDLTQTITSGDATAKVNYVDDALKQLNTLYSKTKSVVDQLRIKQLMERARKEGLTPTEIDELAREYGSEFKVKGFNKLGQALTNVNEQMFENTRKGLKETSRSFLKSDIAKNADKMMSDLIRVKGLTDTMADKVQKLQQRVTERSFGQKLGRAAGQTIDILSGGILKGAIGAMFPSNIGLKTMNSIDIENALAKNLKLIEYLDKAPDDVLQNLLKSFLARHSRKPALNILNLGGKNGANFPRDAKLTGRDAQVQEASIQKYLGNKERMLDEYTREFGKVSNADLARRLFRDVGYNGRNSAAVHEASSALSKDAWRNALATNPQKDALIYSGGSGTGKTSAVDGVLPGIEDAAAAVLDSNLSKYASAKERITEAIRAGKRPVFVYVYRDPVDAWINGVVKRMNENAAEGGRVVPLSTFLENHPGSLKVMQQLATQNFKIHVVDNSLGRGKAVLSTLDRLETISYDIPKLRAQLLKVTKQMLDAGHITKDQYEALIK